MTEFSCKVPTSKEAGSVTNVPGYAMPANIHLFVAVDEIGKDGFLVRKIYSSPDNPHLVAKNLPEFQMKHEVWPENMVCVQPRLTPMPPWQNTYLAAENILQAIFQLAQSSRAALQDSTEKLSISTLRKRKQLEQS